MVDKHYITSADADLELRSDLKNTYAVNGYVGNLHLNELRKDGQVSLAEGSFNVDATMRGKRLDASVNGLFPHVDLYQLGIVDHPLTSSFAANASFGTDGREGMTLRGVLGDLKVKDQQRSYAPGDVHVDLMSRRDTVHTSITAGDFHLSTAFNSSVNKLVKTGQRIAKTLQAQIENKRIDQPATPPSAAEGHFTLTVDVESLQ